MTTKKTVKKTSIKKAPVKSSLFSPSPSPMSQMPIGGGKMKPMGGSKMTMKQFENSKAEKASDKKEYADMKGKGGGMMMKKTKSKMKKY